MAELKDCINAALKATIAGVDQPTKKEILEDLRNRLAQKEEAGLSPEEAQTELFREMIKEADRNKKFAVAQQLDVALKVDDTVKFVEDANELDDSKPLWARINGIASRTKVWARGKSANLRRKELRFDRMGRFANALEEANVLKFYQNKRWLKQYGGDVLEEIRNPGGSKNPDAEKIGKVIKTFFDESLAGLHEAGIPVNEIEGFMGTQSHDPMKMLMPKKGIMGMWLFRRLHTYDFEREDQLAYERWRDTQLQHLDHDKTFGTRVGNPKEVDTFMRAVYDTLTINNPYAKIKDKDKFAFSGLAQLAERKRVLFYKDGWSFAKANREYGYGDVASIIEHTLNKAADIEVAAKEFSTKPYTYWDRVKRALKKRLKDKPAHLRRKLSDRLDKVDRLFDEFTGLAKIPQHATSAHLTNSVLCANALMAFGKSIKAAINDLPGWMIQLHQGGEGWVPSFFIPFQHLVKRLLKVETTAKDLKDLGYWQKYITGDVMSRMASADSLSGLQAKMMGMLFKLNLIKPWDRFLVGGINRDTARMLWDLSKLSFDELPEPRKFLLQRYNISSDEWDLIRKNSFQDIDNRKYITPDDPLKYSKEDVAKFLGKDKISTKEYQDATLAIRRKLIGMSVDRAHFVYLDPDLTTQAITRFGTRPGTIGGNLTRLMIQGYSWPIGIVHRILGSMLSNTMEGEGLIGKGRGFIQDIPGLSLYIAGIATTSYLSRAIGNAARGEKPPKFLSLNSIAATSEEVLGFYGRALTALLGKKQYGQDPLISLMGPAIRNADDITKIVSQMLHGQKFGSPLYHLLKNVPPLNLIYTAPVFNYLIGYHIQEMLSPGSLRRALRAHQRRVAAGEAQEYFLPPPAS